MPLLLILAFLGILLTSFAGSLVLESKSGQTHYIDLKQKEKSSEVRLTSGSVVKKPILLGWTTQDLTLKTTGLPSASVKLTPFMRTKVKVPDDFYRPLVLLWPQHLLTQKANNLGGKLTIELERKGTRKPLVTNHPYQGQTIWLGCQDDVPIPKQKRDMKHLELSLNTHVKEGPRKLSFSRWSTVSAVAADYRPQDNDHLFVMIKGPQGILNAQKPLVVNIRDKKTRGSNFEDHVLHFDLTVKERTQ